MIIRKLQSLEFLSFKYTKQKSQIMIDLDHLFFFLPKLRAVASSKKRGEGLLIIDCPSVLFPLLSAKSGRGRGHGPPSTPSSYDPA